MWDLLILGLSEAFTGGAALELAEEAMAGHDVWTSVNTL